MNFAWGLIAGLLTAVLFGSLGKGLAEYIKARYFKIKPEWFDETKN